MIDQMFDRDYQHGRTALNREFAGFLRAFGKGVGDALRSLHRVQWDSPWAPERGVRRHAHRQRARA